MLGISLPSLSLRDKIIIVIFGSLFIFVPSFTFLLSQSLKTKPATQTSTDGQPVTKLREVPKSAALQNYFNSQAQASPSPSPTDTLTSQLTFGPKMNFKIKIQGRPDSDQSTKLFLGIASGQPTSTPQYVLTYTVDVPKSGSYEGVNLSGLNVGGTYTAILKGQAQIATSAAFIANPSVVNLNPTGDPIMLLTGDLNEDNVVNSSDLSIAQKALGSTASSTNWNPAADFNLDGVVNNFDLGLINQNLGKIGATGAWYSRIGTATPSASKGGGPIPSPINGQDGYWMWFPKL